MRSLAAVDCVLEPLCATHAHEMFAVLSDPAIYEFENAPPPNEDWLRQRYERLERRVSSDGTQHWLNWVIRLPGGDLAGYVQATVLPYRECFVAYELNSRYWRQGIGTRAVRAMLDELCRSYAVDTFIAVLKATNHRSERLLRTLGFGPASEVQAARHRDAADELVFIKSAASAPTPIVVPPELHVAGAPAP